MAEELLEVTVSDPDRVLWKGKANSVSSENLQGPFDILPQHANFITIVQKQPIRIQTANEKKEFNFNNAIIYNWNNKVNILTSTELKI